MSDDRQRNRANRENYSAPSYRDIAVETVRDNRYYIYLLSLFPILMLWLVTVAMLVHVHITEVGVLATLEAREGISYASRPRAGLYINFFGETLLLILCVQGLRSSRGEVK